VKVLVTLYALVSSHGFLPEFLEFLLVNGCDFGAVDYYKIFIVELLTILTPVKRSGENGSVVYDHEFVVHTTGVCVVATLNSVSCECHVLTVLRDLRFLKDDFYFDSGVEGGFEFGAD